MTQHRDELLSKMDAETRRQKLDYCSKLEERDALLKLEANLKKQLELINQAKTVPDAPPVQHNRLQGSSMRATRNDDTLTEPGSDPSRPLQQQTHTPDSTSSGESQWVFLDSR